MIQGGEKKKKKSNDGQVERMFSRTTHRLLRGVAVYKSKERGGEKLLSRSVQTGVLPLQKET